MTGNPPAATQGVVGQTTIDQGANTNLFLHFAVQLAGGKGYLGDETLKLVSFSGSDGISDHFQYQLELHGDSDPTGQVTPNIAFQFNDLIGRPVTVGINQPTKSGARGLPPAPENADDDYTRQESCAQFLLAVKESWPADSEESAEEMFTFFNGIVASFAMSQPGVYQLTMRPAAWRATLTNEYRIHEQKSIRKAIEGVLNEHHVEHTLEAVAGADNPADYRIQDWLQAGESDYDFIQRLMSKAHIYYYYRHGPTSHTLFFANNPDYAEVYDPSIFPGGHKLRYAFTNEDALGLEQEDLITQYRYEESISSSGVDGVLSRQQAAWEENDVAQFFTYRDARNEEDTDTNPGELSFQRFQIYQYGGSTDETKWTTKHTANSLHASTTSLSGAGHCARFRAGHQFQMADADAKQVTITNPDGTTEERTSYYPTSIRPTLHQEPFVLTRVEHNASLDGGYSNQFQATEASGLVTPFSIQDTQQGSVMAEVVHVDNGVPPNGWKYYYKDNFDPEQSRLTDPKSPKYPDDEREFRPEGVYVRFATDAADAPARWVKLAAHMQTAPEIGVTVMVARSYYADELPEIQSIVQNNGNKTVTPCGWTANTNVGSNFSTSYGDSKSNRFGLNSAGAPEVAVTVSNAPSPVTECDPKGYGGGAGPADHHGMLDTAVKIIENQYDTGQFRDSSYSQGASYSFSTSESGKGGLLSKSDSFGSSYSHHEGAESKSYSEIDYSYSNSVMVNVDSYTTISVKSYSESTIGETESISDIINNSTNTSTIGGNSVNTSTIVGNSINTSTINGNSVNDSTLDGNSDNTSTIGGYSNSESTIVGNSDNTSTINGNSDNTSTVDGNSTSESTVKGNSDNTSTVNGNSDNTSTVDGDSTSESTIKGKSKNTSTVNGKSSNYSTVDGLSYSESKFNGGSENHNNVTGDSKNYSDVTGQSYNKSSSGTAVNISSVGSQSGTTTVGAQAHATAIGAQANATAIGATANANAVGASADVSVTAAAANVSLKGVIANADITGTGVAYQNDSGVVKLGNKGTDIEMILTIEIIM